MTTITVNPLSNKSIDDAISRLRHYKSSLEEFPNLYVDALTTRLDEILGGQAPQMASGTWNAYVIHKDEKAEGVIVFDQEVEFIEFGTGIVGKKNHAGINEEWLKKLPPPYTEYNAGSCIHHFQNEDMDYWAYFEDGKWKITHGIPADPFIYRSVQSLIDEHVSIARDVLKQIGMG